MLLSKQDRETMSHISNTVRKDFIADQISSKDPKIV